jgi:multidrug efflux system membrane fusion protein
MNNLTSPDRNNLPPANGKSARRRWLIRLVWLLALIAIGAGIYHLVAQRKAEQADTAASGGGGRRGGGAAGANRPTPVVSAPVRIGDIDVYLNGLGAAVPLNSVIVKTQVSGQLMKVLFREGQLVKRGELLAEIDPRPYQVQLTQAEGTMARDQALLKNAQIDLERYRTLFQQDSIAKQQLDTQASLVRQYEGAVKVDQGQIDAAKLQLTYSRITAPISGRIGLRQVDPGNIVQPSDANGLFVITQLQPISVVFTLPEDNIPAVMQKVQAGEKLAVDAYDRAQQTKLASGTLMTVDNQIDPTTGTVKLKAQFANDDYSMFANQFVNTRLLIEVRRGVAIVPSAAIQRGSQGAFVYVVEDGAVTLRTVQTGATQGDDTEIVSGLKANEVVVIDGADKLREGAKVTAVNRDTGAAAGKQPGEHRRHGDGTHRKRDGSDPQKDAPAKDDAAKAKDGNS